VGLPIYIKASDVVQNQEFKIVRLGEQLGPHYGKPFSNVFLRVRLYFQKISSTSAAPEELEFT
jgi:hypothetical protein